MLQEFFGYPAIQTISPFPSSRLVCFLLATTIEVFKDRSWLRDFRVCLSTICYKRSDSTTLCVVDLHLQVVFPCLIVLCMYWSVVGLRLPDGHNLITSLYPPPHSAPGPEQCSVRQRIFLWWTSMQCSVFQGSVGEEKERSVITAAVSARFSSRLLQGREEGGF